MIDKKIFTKYVWAFTLGDGGLTSLKRQSKIKDPNRQDGRSHRPKNSKYYLKQKDDHKDYVDWQSEILEELTSVSIQHYPPYTDKRGFNVSGHYELTTRCHPFYTKMRKRVYLNNRKIISPHDLKLLDWECLAILYQDDGQIEINQRKTKDDYVRITLHTLSFTYGDNLLLKRAIFEKTSIPFDVSRKRCRNEWKYLLRTPKTHALRFIEGIEKYILPSFEYKISYR